MFGGGLPSARVLIAAGADIPDALLQRHRRRHQGVVGERLAGQTTNFAIFSDGSADGDAAASVMLQVAEADYRAIQRWFKGIVPPSLPFYVYTDPGAGGAFHITCAGTDVHVSADPARAPGFLTAEVVEVFEAAQAKGWDCAYTNGEVLSRVLAFERHPEIAPDFLATEQNWWLQGHADYVNDNSAGDRDQLANGCGDLFLYYLHGQLTFSWEDIIAAGGENLGQTYRTLTGYEGLQGFNDFISVLSTIDRGDGLDLPASGDPFPVKA